MNRNDIEAIARIADRAVKLFETAGVKLNRLEVMMDLEYCNEEDIALDFEKLMKFDDQNFGHDIGGIQRHFNRETKKLEDCFVPRCAYQPPAAGASS